MKRCVHISRQKYSISQSLDGCTTFCNKTIKGEETSRGNDYTWLEYISHWMATDEFIQELCKDCLNTKDFQLYLLAVVEL
jgi:hypothetical protein